MATPKTTTARPASRPAARPATARASTTQSDRGPARTANNAPRGAATSKQPSSDAGPGFDASRGQLVAPVSDEVTQAPRRPRTDADGTRDANSLPAVPDPTPTPGKPKERTVQEVKVESEAVSAAGPHRPEPARQRFPDAGLAVPQDVRDAQRRPTRPVMKVMAVQTGYYGEMRRRPGDVFWLTEAKHFSKTWMRRVSDRTPEKVTTGQQQIRKEHDERIVAQRTGNAQAAATVDQSLQEQPIADDDDRIDTEP